MENKQISDETNIRRVCIFAHFDKNDIVDDYVYYYLSELKSVTSDIVFVSVSNISASHIKLLKQKGIQVIVRKNIGYDFYSYKTGLDSINLNKYDELILCNDSVYGPLFNFDNVLNQMSNNKCDFWGFTDSNQISYHLQSYFLVFKKSVIHSKRFKSFWDSLEVLDDKLIIIEKYEVGLSSILLKEFSSSVIFPVENVMSIRHYFSRTLNNIKKTKKCIFMLEFYLSFARDLYSFITVNFHPNSIVHFWKDAITCGEVPFIKIGLFKQESFTSDEKEDLISILSRLSDYPIELIEDHQKRLNSHTQ